jgi:hypothetical protein
VKQRLIVIAALALAVAAIAVSGSAAGEGPQTLDLTATVLGYHVVVDAKPAGHSAGDMGYIYGNIFEHGKRVGRFQGLCTQLPRSNQQCSYKVGLHGGQLILESGYRPGFNTGPVALEAVVGGTGAYDGARGQGRDREVTNTKLAFHLELIR